MQNTRFYLDYAVEVYIYYEKLLFSIYKEGNLLFVCTMDYTKPNILEKYMVILDVFVDSKFKVIKFYNILCITKLEYNLLLVDIIKKVDYLI